MTLLQLALAQRGFRRLPQHGLSTANCLSAATWAPYRSIVGLVLGRRYWRGRSLDFYRLPRRGFSLAECLSAASPACRQRCCVLAGSLMSEVGISP